MKTAKKTKFTFRRDARRTGLAGVGYPHQSVDIKHNRLRVGRIGAPDWTTKDSKWCVGFMLEGSTGNPKCSWSWRFLKKRFDSEQEARDWVVANAEKIIGWNLRHEPKDE